MALPPPRPVDPSVTLRPAEPGDLGACAEIWRDALNDYMGRLQIMPVGQDLGPISRLHAHLHSTDPERFWVAERDRRIVGFGSAIVRGRAWFLSMLFVRPGEQNAGIGRAILARIMPPPGDGLALATATDSAQPISNGLYASLGMVPREPLLSLVGLPDGEPLPQLPPGTTGTAFEALVTNSGQADGHASLVGTINRLDDEIVGFSHPQDHRMLRMDGRQGFLYRDADGSEIGYGYASPVGRVGPVVVREQALMAAVLGHLLAAVRPRGAFAIWLPGSAGATITALVRAGFRVDGFPVLLCWDRPFADFSRYIPNSPGLP
jgi:hypothetical protein